MRRTLGFALLAVVLLITPGAAARQDAGTPWRDLAAAEAQLGEAQAELANAQIAVADAEAALSALKTDRLATSDEQVAYAVELQATEQLARTLAIEAYISQTPVAEAIYLLDAEGAADLAYRTGILVGSADAVSTSSQAFLDLRNDASDETIALAAEIDLAAVAVDDALARVARAETLVADKEWVVTIATIHSRADELSIRYGHSEPTDEHWANLRFCESTENYQVATGNGYWGAYQFDIPTWLDMGGTGLPSDAPPEEQDARARYLYHLRGWGPWPVCGRFLPQD